MKPLILDTPEELESELRKGEIRQVYLILGPEQYLCREALAALKKAVVAPEALAFDYSEFAAGEVPVDQIIETASTFPMISRRRVVFVNDVERLKESEQETLTDSIKSLPLRSVLILSAFELDHRKRFYKTLRDECCIAEFPKLKGPAL